MLFCLSKLFYPLTNLDVGRGADGNDCGDCEKGHLSSPELLSPSIGRLESTSPKWLEMASLHQSIGGSTLIKRGQRGSTGTNMARSAPSGIAGPIFISAGSWKVTRQSGTLHGT